MILLFLVYIYAVGSSAATVPGRSRNLQASLGTVVHNRRKTGKSSYSYLPKHCQSLMANLDKHKDDPKKQDQIKNCQEYSNYPTISPTTSQRPTIVVSSTPTVSTVPSDQPTLSPTTRPSIVPSLSPTLYPSHHPTKVPSQHPSASPTVSNKPSSSPTISSKPSITKTFELYIPNFYLELKYNNARRLSYSGRPIRRNLATSIRMNEDVLKEKLNDSISASYKRHLPFFDHLSLQLKFDKKITSSEGITIRYIFGGSIFFVTNRIEDIPKDSQLRSYTELALSNDSLRGVTNPEYSSLSLSIVDNMDFWTNSTSTKDNGSSVGEIQVVESSGSMLLTIGVCSVATLTTIAAITLIFTQKERILGKDRNDSPSSTMSVSPRSMRNLTPFSDSPSELVQHNSRKFFLRLDDDSTITSQPHRYETEMHCPDEESSLEAPSMVGISSVNEKSTFGESSIDAESLTNMSALDEVRLGSVLQIEESSVLGVEGSNAQGKKAFSQLWNGKHTKRRAGGFHAVEVNQKTYEASGQTLGGSDMALVHSHNGESVIDTDGISLLGDQSIKNEYYGPSIVPNTQSDAEIYEDSDISLGSKSTLAHKYIGDNHSSTSMGSQVEGGDSSHMSIDGSSRSSLGLSRYGNRS